jgi:xanthine dehydrogenase accessory factor
MNEMLNEICQALVSGQKLTAAMIITNSGSTPRTSGSRMIVYPDGTISGTIGGGAVEGDVIQRALRLVETEGAEIVPYDLNRTDSIDRMDLICGGRVKILIEHVTVNEKNIELYRSAQEEIKKSRPFSWIAKLTDNEGRLKTARALLTSRNEFVGPIQVHRELLNLAESDTRIFNKSCFIETGKISYVLESIKPPETLFLFGAGHVSKEIAALSGRIGFRIVVFDDRSEFANAERFPDADEILVCPEYAEVFKGFNTHPNDCIVIVTRGHRFDKEVLAQALQTEAGYIGMIGSRRKRETIYRILMQQGVEQRVLEQVHCPVGLSIKAETPAEIAVSVTAQLIHHRAERRNHE